MGGNENLFRHELLPQPQKPQDPHFLPAVRADVVDASDAQAGKKNVRQFLRRTVILDSLFIEFPVTRSADFHDGEMRAIRFYFFPV